MYLLEEAFISIRSFFEAGGDVLWAIFLVTMLMWTLIVEKFWFFKSVLPLAITSTTDEWDARSNKSSWRSVKIREQMISEISIESHRNISIIQVLMVLLPLLACWERLPA